MKNRCLVLGGNGFLGYYVTNELAKNKDNEIRCLEYRMVSKEDAVPGVEYIVGDAFNAEVLKQVMHGTDSVYYFISTSLPNSGERFLDNEIRLTLNSLDMTLKIMTECGARNFIYPSSGGAIYGDQSNVPVSEETMLAPSTAYGVGKQMSEALIGFYCRKHGINANIFRIGNVYGSERMRDKPQGVIDVFIQAVLQDEPIKIWGDASNSVRDYIYLNDAAKAIVSTANLNQEGFNVYNVGTGIGTSLQEIVDLIEKIIGHPIKIERIPQKASGVSSIVLNSNKIRAKSGWRPTVGLEEGIKKAVGLKKGIICK